MKPWFETVAKGMNETDGTKLYFFNIEQDKDFVVNEMGIRSVPTIKIFKKGTEVFSQSGVMQPAQVLSLLN
jgi:thioredoxin-like negative regulator of GroEL